MNLTQAIRLLFSNFSRYVLLISFSLALVFGSYQKSFATHAMGMDLTYTQLSQDSFLVTLAFYRDCDGVNAPNSATLRIRSASCNYNFTQSLPRIGNGQETTPICQNLTTKCNGGNFPGSEEYIYQKIIVLPAVCSDWTISNEICCRNNAITTINNPGGQNIYVEAKINNNYLNSSPVFSNPPVPFVCANQNYCFNNGAIDQEGDSLVYSLITPRTGINVGDTVVFKAGFDKFNPLTSTPALSLDSVNGDLCMFPTDSNETAVLAVLVQEYRNGVLISSIMRDIQLRILGCPGGNDLPVASGIDSTNKFTAKVCANSNITFQIYAADTDTSQDVTMTWNQGIANASFNIAAGSRPIGTFSWTPTINDVRNQAHCFTVSVTDDNCPFNGQQVFSYCIYVVGVAAITDSLIMPSCFDECDGRSMVRVVNGIPPFTYLWNDPLTQTTARATNLCAGTYTVAGSDSTGCTTNTTVTIDQPKQIIPELDFIPVSCAGGSDGKALVKSIMNGFAPFTYLWDINAASQATDTAISLAAGTYSVTVTDSNNCSATDSITITEPLPLLINPSIVANVSCNGLSDGEATVSVFGGTAPYTYQWGAFSGNQTTDTATNLFSGYHVISVTDAKGCITTDSIFITEPATAINLALTTIDILCKGDSTGSATVVASGGTPPYFYTWSANTGSQTTSTATNLPAGIYSVTVTDINNCVALPNIVISEPNDSLALTPLDSFVACNGDMNGVAGVFVFGGTSPYTYLWDANAGNQTTKNATGLGAGTYSVLVNDSVGCPDSVDVQIFEANAPLIVNIGKIDVSCNNGSDGKAFVSISGGIAPYTIQWGANTGSQTTDTASNLTAGTYLVSVIDSFGCSIDTSIIVNEPPPLLTLVMNSSNVACFGDSSGTASVVVSGGTPPYLYTWSPNSGSQTTDTAVGLVAGTYFVTVFDSNFCVISPGVVINEPASSLSANLFTKDANCFGENSGFAVVNGIGGSPPYIYNWDTLANSQTTDTAFNLTAQTYNVRVTDSFNCVFDTLVNILQPSAPLQVSLSAAPVLCFSGGDGEAYANITGGTLPYQIQWGALSNFQTTDTANGLMTGYHVITVNDTNNCSIEDSVFVGGPALPLLINTDVIHVRCYENSDGIAIAKGSGGTAPYSYQWDGSTGNQANDTAFNLRAGSYDVTITDSNGCDTLFTVVVNQPTELRDSVFISSDYNGTSIRCFGDSSGEATAVGLGGISPYTYQWDTTANNQTTSIATNLYKGVFSVVITDSNNCQTTGFVTMDGPDKISSNVGQLKDASCYGGNDGRIIVGGTGGNAPYTYSWNTSPIVSDSILDSISAGTYTVTITDTNNCTFDTTLSIGQADSLYTDSISSIDAKCFGESSGAASVFPNGGTPPYSYSWETSPGIFQITRTAINLTAGTYGVVITDANDCIVTDTTNLGEGDQIFATVSENDTICANTPNVISASASGGDSTFYKYLWLPTRPDSLPNQTVSPSVTTNYAVRAMDAQGCISTPVLTTVFVRNMDDDTLRVTSNGDICEGDTGYVTGFHNGPFGNYEYNWNFGKKDFGPHAVTPDTATYYAMTVSDVCGNEIVDSVLIKVNPNPNLRLDSVLAEGCNPLTVVFDDTSNTMSNLTYLWQFGDGNASIQKNPTYTFVLPGTYEVTLAITSDKNCTSSNKDKPSLVKVFPTPKADFSANPNRADMRNPSIDFDNESNGGQSYIWKFGDGDSSTTFDASHTYGDTGRYLTTLITISDKGCSDTTQLNIFIDPYYFITVPNAFTPSSSSNGGGWRKDPAGNRIFYPFTEFPEAVSEYELLVFNRWGELIFESEDIYLGWDGFYRGKQSPQEVYVYKLKVRWENGQEFENVGDVTLFR